MHGEFLKGLFLTAALPPNLEAMASNLEAMACVSSSGICFKLILLSLMLAQPLWGEIEACLRRLNNHSPDSRCT